MKKRSNMKKQKSFLLIIFLLLILQQTNAQRIRSTHEVAFSYGIGGVFDFTNVYEGPLLKMSKAVMGDSIGINKRSSTGAIVFAYQHHFSTKVSALAMFGFESLKNNATLHKELIGEVSHTSITVAAEVQYRYFEMKKVAVYCGLGAGMAIINSKSKPNNGMLKKSNSTSQFIFQVTGLGVRVGKKLAGIAEIGYGYKGC
jgi:hypothetical protein